MRANLFDENNPAIMDRNAWLKMVEQSKNPLLVKGFKYPLSDGRTISLALFPNAMERAIRSLPEKEQTKIRALSKAHRKLQTKMNGYRQQAYGLGIFRQFYNPGVVKHYKFLDVKQEELLDLFGRMFSIAEVHRMAVEEWHIPVAYGAVQEWRLQHLEEITERIETFKQTTSDLRIETKRGRLEELVWLYQTMKDKYRKNNGVLEHRSLLGNIEHGKVDTKITSVDEANRRKPNPAV